MLRNQAVMRQIMRFVFVLNEVLSLNAQEWRVAFLRTPILCFLNEVLSLNAQESVTRVLPLSINVPQ